MKQKLKPAQENTPDKLSYLKGLPIKKIIPERKKIRQLLRSMIPMKEDERELKEEQSFPNRTTIEI